MFLFIFFFVSFVCDGFTSCFRFGFFVVAVVVVSLKKEKKSKNVLIIFELFATIMVQHKRGPHATETLLILILFRRSFDFFAEEILQQQKIDHWLL